jgi:hypothetical protein
MAKSSTSRSAPRKPGSKRRVPSPQPPGAEGMEVSAVAVADKCGLGPDLRAHLGSQLRAIYHEVVSEQVPDRFLRLLDDLARKDA